MEDAPAAGAEATSAIGEKERHCDLQLMSPETKKKNEFKDKYLK